MKDEIIRNLLKFNTPRRVVQFLSFLFLCGTIFNLSSLPVLIPVLWTWGLEPNIAGDAFTAIQLLSYNVTFPWLAIASFLIVGILLGKSFCGWVCPFGFIQDLIGLIKRKKREFSPRTHKSMIYVKYGILVVALLISTTVSAAKILGISDNYESALGVFAKAPFTSLSPAETLFATLPKMISDFRNATSEKPFLDVLPGITTLPALFWVQFIVMICVLVFVALIPRGFCKYFCPHGAIMAVMNKFSFLGLCRDPVKCAKGGCRRCVEVCPMNVRILDLPWEKFSDPECTYCLKCVDACPDKAIRLKYP